MSVDTQDTISYGSPESAVHIAAIKAMERGAKEGLLWINSQMSLEMNDPGPATRKRIAELTEAGNSISRNPYDRTYNNVKRRS